MKKDSTNFNYKQNYAYSFMVLQNKPLKKLKSFDTYEEAIKYRDKINNNKKKSIQ